MDIYLDYSSDIPLTPAGSFETVTGALLTKQRIIRRLLTNPGSYIWHPNYGAGLGAYIGKNMSPSMIDEIIGKVRSQIFLENTVSKSNPPTITVQQDPSNMNNLIIYIQYYDANLNLPFSLTFTVGN